MNFDDNFRRIGSANIEHVKALAATLTDEDWTQESVRQQRYEVHKDTQSIPLVHDDDFRHTEPTQHPALQTFAPVIRPILAITADFFDSSEKGRALTEKHGIGYFIRANLVRLAPGGTIDEHRDGNFSLTHSHRVHVPIITNDRVLFKVGRETLSIPEGVLRAYVVVSKEISGLRVRSWCRQHLAGYKVPRSVVLVEEIPRTVRGKIDRAALAALSLSNKPSKLS